MFTENDLSLKINRSSCEKFTDILQLQPRGELSYSHEKGVYNTDAYYLDKVEKFLILAKKLGAGLVITPEYSVPYSLILNILHSEENWPEQSNLWCLCAEGIEVDKFKTLLRNIKINPQIQLAVEEKISYRKFVNALWYIFRINEEKLGVVIQLKQSPMSDPMFIHEGDDLSLGETTYVFDLNGGQSTMNVLVTLICADAIQLSVSELIHEIRATSPILINPQLNGKPFDDRFVAFRKTFFNDSNIKEQRMIVSNWAECTNVNAKQKVSESGSAYYNYLNVNGLQRAKDIATNSSLFKYQLRVQREGMIYFCDSNYNIWSIGNVEHCIRYYVKKGYVFGVTGSMTSDFDPCVRETFQFTSENNWEMKKMLKCEQFNSRDYLPTKEEYYPVNYCGCEDHTCTDECIWLYNDFFFGICFGGFIKEEIVTKNEISNRTVINLNADSLKNTKKKRTLFGNLVELIENNCFPESLMMFKSNSKFEIDHNAAATCSNNLYNLAVKEIPEHHLNWNEKKGIFVILDTEELAEVERLYNDLRVATKEDYKDQIVIYYRKRGRFSFYETPFRDPSFGVRNPSFTVNTSSIIWGGMKYE